MEIKITQVEEKIFFEWKGEKKEFTYDNIDYLIDNLVKIEEEIVVNADSNLNNYKLLIEEIIKDIRSDDFKTSIKELSNDATDDEIKKKLSSVK